VEAARCFEEGVITDPRDADVGAILGWGFAPWTGGPISLIDGVGVAKFVEACDAWPEVRRALRAAAAAARHGRQGRDLLQPLRRQGEGRRADDGRARRLRPRPRRPWRPRRSRPRRAPSSPRPASRPGALTGGGEALRQAARQSGCTEADIVKLTKAERAACAEALGAKNKNGPALYAAIDPDKKAAFDGDCKKDDDWCLYRTGKGPYPGLFALGKKKKIKGWDSGIAAAITCRSLAPNRASSALPSSGGESRKVITSSRAVSSSTVWVMLTLLVEGERSGCACRSPRRVHGSWRATKQSKRSSLRLAKLVVDTPRAP
jgi:hypothetical protein